MLLLFLLAAAAVRINKIDCLKHAGHGSAALIYDAPLRQQCLYT